MIAKKTCIAVLFLSTGFLMSAFLLRKPALFSGDAINARDNASLQFAFDYSAATSFLKPPYISSVADDAEDPAAVKGIFVTVKENGKPLPAADYTISVSCDNESVLPAAKVVIKKLDGVANVRMMPAAPGYCNITLTLSRGKTKAVLEIFFAASAGATGFPSKIYWHTGVSDASAVVALDRNYMAVADDENNLLLVYDRSSSGLPAAVFNYARFMNLPEGESIETDCEGGTSSLRNPQRSYWIGSMSNGGSRLTDQPNRNCLFATDISGTGAAVQFSFKGAYLDLRRYILKWGDANGYKFSSSAEGGRIAKRPDGFNIEGIVFGPDSNTLYIGFRAPIVPPTNRTKALIAPLENFEDWFNAGKPAGKPSIGKPIELDLGGRGIRDFIRMQNGQYVIIAGNSDDLFNAALYLWSGKPSDKPELVNAMEKFPCKAESGLEVIEHGKATGKVQVISDNGSTIFYGDDVPAKLLNKNFAKFRDDVMELYPGRK